MSKETVVKRSSLKGKKSPRKQPNIPSKLDEAQKAVLALKTTMDDEASTLLEERETFEIMRKKLDNVHFKKHIKLNVGGQIFKTSIETLVKDPDSMLASMFSERFEVKPDEEDNAYFIDRDGTHFRFILNYLRTGKLIYPKADKDLARELYLEAEFYQISGIQNEMWPGATFKKSSYIINNLSTAQRDALMSIIPRQDAFLDWVELYSSSNHGWSSSYFHKNCDNKGPTFVIAMASGYIFGGYTGVSWNSDGSFVQDENAFLFTLANPTGSPPTKLPQSDGTGGIWCNASYGPGFGTATGYNIYFMNSSGTSNCGINNNNVCFVTPEGHPFTNFIYGNTTAFGMNYLEVFGLQESSR